MILQIENPINFWLPWMRRAIQLASISDGFTSPNPIVGSIVLDSNNELIGEGFHSFAGGPHAEVEALKQAGERAKRGTLIVTLEPCCHFGKTPPCTQAIIDSGIKRVVVGLIDPDPRVSGRGISLLKDAGIEVITGVLKEEVEYQNREFVFRVKNGRPWGILKWAMSIDGRIALSNGKSKWISGKESRESVYRLRAKCDAVIVGGGTVRADDPLLTSRGLINREPLRVVLTNQINLPKNSKVFDTSIANTLIAYGAKHIDKSLFESQEGIELLKLNSLEPINLLNALADRGCNRVLWECGSKLATEAIKQNCVQEIFVFVAPKLLGGASAMTPLADLGFQSMNELISMDQLNFQKFGQDFLIKTLLK